MCSSLSRSFIAALVLAGGFISVSQAQVDTAWVRKYNGADDILRDVAVDGSGNVYVTGHSGGDYGTARYNANGTLQWFARYSGPGGSTDAACALAVDAVGSVFVTGYSTGLGSSFDYATAKYNSEGTLQWVARYNGPANSVDQAVSMALDSYGNVYVTGCSHNGSNHDYATIKYNTAGDTVWVRRYNGLGTGQDYANALVVDGSGNVYVTGTSLRNTTDYDHVTVKYSPTGDQLWVSRFYCSGSSENEPHGLAVDASGNVYVTGGSYNGANFDYYTAKYNSNGTQQWLVSYNGPGNAQDRGRDLAVDALGNVYVTGFSYIGSYNDYATVKYNSDGVQQWVARYNGAGLQGDDARDLELDAAGNVYVTGASRGFTGSYWDCATVKYNPAGLEQWAVRYDGLGGYNGDYANALALDASGNVYVAGASAASDDDYLTIKYVQSGASNPQVAIAPLRFDLLLRPDQLQDTVLVVQNLGGAALAWNRTEVPPVSWMSESPTGGTVNPGDSAELYISINTAGLALGTYSCTLRITSNDPVNPIVNVPVELMVVESVGVFLTDVSIPGDSIAPLPVTPSVLVENSTSGSALLDLQMKIVWGADTVFRDTRTISVGPCSTGVIDFDEWSPIEGDYKVIASMSSIGDRWAQTVVKSVCVDERFGELPVLSLPFKAGRQLYCSQGNNTPVGDGWTHNSRVAGVLPLDFANNAFSPPVPAETIVAAAAGIAYCYKNQDGWGNFVKVLHGDFGSLYSLYAHLSDTLVRSGSYVTRGQPIGVEGGTGGWPRHIHFGLYRGRADLRAIDVATSTPALVSAAYAFHPDTDPAEYPLPELYGSFQQTFTALFRDQRFNGQGQKTKSSYPRRHWYKSDNPSVRMVWQATPLRAGATVTVTGRLEDYDGNPFVPGASEFGVNDPFSQASAIIPVQGDGSFTYTTGTAPDASALYALKFILTRPCGAREWVVVLPVNRQSEPYRYESELSVDLGTTSLPFDAETDALVVRPTGSIPAPTQGRLWDIGSVLGLELAFRSKIYAGKWLPSPPAPSVLACGAVSASSSRLVQGGHASVPAAVWTMSYPAGGGTGRLAVDAAKRMIDAMPVGDKDRWKAVAEPATNRVGTAVALAATGGAADIAATAQEVLASGVTCASAIHTELEGGQVTCFVIIGATASGRVFVYGAVPFEAKGLRIAGYCPIDLTVTDPDGRTASKTAVGIPGAVYTETDINGDGELDDEVYIPNPGSGVFRVNVEPDTSAVATDSFSLLAEYTDDDSTLVLARDVKLRYLPRSPYLLTFGGAGWTECAPMPTTPSGREPKDGAWLTTAGAMVYAAKGNKTGDFYQLDPWAGTNGEWRALESIPSGEDGRTKRPSKGCAAVSDGENHVYMTKGNNTLGFWRYDVTADSWVRLPAVPAGPESKKVKGGNDLAYVPGNGDTGYVYLLKGYRTEFYRFNTLTLAWDTLDNVPYGGGKQKYDKGSFLVYDGAGGLYAHQAKYNDGTNHYMFRYDLGTQQWQIAPLKGMPLAGLYKGVIKNKKSKDGAAGAFGGDYLYALKGGNTCNLYRYFPTGDSWEELDTLPSWGSAQKSKRVKGGGDLAGYGPGAFFALKGNKTGECWRYVEPTLQASSFKPQARNGVMSERMANGEWRMAIASNPLSSGWANVRYSLPKSGPVSISVFDVAGRSVLSVRTPGHSAAGTLPLDLRTLADGVYLVRFSSGAFTSSQKLVVQR